MNFFRKIGFQLGAFFLIAILIPILLLSVSSISTTKTSMDNNLKITSEQTLAEAQKGFTIYLKTLSQPVDLLTRKNEIKHLEDQGDLETNIKAIKDSLVASVKVTNGAELAFFTTKTGYKLTGWTEYNESTGKTASKGDTITNANDTKESWYTGCIGSPARNTIYAAFSDPYIDSNGKKIFTVSQEIKYTTGENYGAVGLNIDFSEVEEYVGDINLLNTGFVILVNSEGDILVNDESNTYVTDSVKNLAFWNTMSSLEDDQLDTVFSFDEKINGKSVHIVSSKDAVTGWTLVGFIDSSETQSTVTRITISSVFFSIISFIVGIVIAIVFTTSLTKEMKKVNVAMNRMASGDLTHRITIKKKNEFGTLEKNYNEMVDNVSTLIRGVEEKSGILIEESEKISDISKTTTETVDQVSEAIMSVSLGAAGQAESTQNATNEVETLATKLRETKAYVSDINDMSIETQQLSEHGIEIVDELISKGEKSIENSHISKNVVREMVESIDKINFISDAITEITEQTNLLSLNASIEAARAGESGKGFAVVADEIRKLAEQSQSSTDEIKKILVEISDKSQLMEQTMDESVEIIAEQNKSINSAKELFNTISTSVNALKEGLDNITKLNEQMDTNRENVVEKMEDVASVATETAAASEEVTASAQEVNATMKTLNEFTFELEEIANNLKEAINKFSL